MSASHSPVPNSINYEVLVCPGCGATSVGPDIFGRPAGVLWSRAGLCHLGDAPSREAIRYVPAEPTDEMVERAARAMSAVEADSLWEVTEAHLEIADRSSLDVVADEDKDWFRRHARAALTAASSTSRNQEGDG